MLHLFIWLIIFIVSLIVLIKASDYFTDSAEKIGLYFGLPAFIVGVTIVAIGTSLPELVSSIFAVLKGSSEIVVGNVVGSNITNIFLILGIAAIIGKKIKVTYELVHVDLPLLIGSAFLLAVTIWDGIFTLPEALLCIGGIILYLLYTIHTQKEYEDVEIKKEMKEELKKRRKLDWKTLTILIVSAFFIYLGAEYTIESVIKLSKILNIGKEIIAISAVALGTSLPELMVTVSAARKGKPEIAVGNVLGSNIFNALAVMGMPAFFGTLIIPHSILTFGLPMMLVATLLYFFMTQDKEITKWEGWMLIIFYVFFIGKVFNLL
ncbi:calcium/sodium antiporter [Methermicoccus shengliensis]|uniref:Calcium/sodium antiporter n=1 Tax=Methermicoccus shengliensis TaxID=660064 RepID=A0A832RWT0_9EURY|nr:calcium/sodium antiporter [Methermicoccus shengliensis]KUK04697.1 MAG: Na+/Ca+ antiporter, CaCA family [Euryarchaeota archaeon 55_53]KUK30536.1 MAG: Na+/Ca+ antiporter, CaCA family [Methanosarcinales archeaon 56_1174]MDI3487443.1 cation:H+ antiporter [Methanosarcinales archaeon]MDN5295228.1 cation:H+ antiporter [Methanosarcinales archaeon]HIH69683.1 calcium/sodium antiporter [Methermicoccus shengliensis]